METIDIKYQDSKIYALRSYQTDKVYIGSTYNTLAKRFGSHKSDFKNPKNYITSHEILKYEDCYIELVEDFPCNSKNELNRREGQVIRETNCVNKFISGRTHREYCNDNPELIAAINKRTYDKHKHTDKFKEARKKYQEEHKEEIADNRRRYYQDNKEEIIEKARLYSKLNKEKIAEKKYQYYQDNKEEISIKAKEYRELNKEKIKIMRTQYKSTHRKELCDKQKVYYQEHKEEIKQKMNIKVVCSVCEKDVSKKNIARHMKTHS